MTAPLSSRPDLAQIKRQAKELLKAQKAGESGVIVGLSTFAAHGVCGLLNLPDSNVPAVTVSIAAGLGETVAMLSTGPG
jgi:hypothetical protein